MTEPATPAVQVRGAEGASAEEAAAIVAALERFARETALPAAAPETLDPWWRVAVLEGVLREDFSDDPVDVWHAWINA